MTIQELVDKLATCDPSLTIYLDSERGDIGEVVLIEQMNKCSLVTERFVFLQKDTSTISQVKRTLL